jgi:predicted ATPase
MVPPVTPQPADPGAQIRLGSEGACVLDRRQRRLLIHGKPAALGSRALEVLLALADRPGELVRKSELLDLVWPDVDVEENNLQVQVSALRRRIGPDAIQTVPGRGYRLVCAGAGAGATAGPMSTRLTALIGRELELFEIDTALDRTGLVTLVGAGGVGKTLLARHVVAGRRARGTESVCWADLTAVDEPARVLPAVALALGLRADAGDEVARLVDAAFGLSLTLVVDNAEHQLSTVARLASALHVGTPGIQLLATSQAPLGIPGECVYRLAALTVPAADAPTEHVMRSAAVRLFCDHARAADRRFVLGAHNLDAVAAVCRGLDGLPLALELAAAHVPRLGVHGVLQGMTERGLMNTGMALEPAGRPIRQRSVQATLAWSLSLLDAAARRVFRRLGVIVGNASLPVLLAVASSPEDDADEVLDALFTLVDRSLVEVSTDDPPRYRLLEIPRAHAIEQLRAAGEEATTRARHATIHAQIFEQAFERYLRAELGLDAWEDQLEPELADARTAWQWALGNDPGMAITLATTTWLALQNRVLQRMTVEWEATLAAITPATPVHLRARAMWAAARALGGAAPTRARELARQAAALARDSRALPMRVLTLATLIETGAYAGDVAGPEVQSALAELSGIDLPDSARVLRQQALGAQHIAAHLAEQRPQALALARQLTVLEQSLGQRHPVAMQNLADAELAAGNVAAAIELGEQLLVRLAGSQSLAALTVVRVNLAAALLAQGEPDALSRSLTLLREAWAGSLHYGHGGVVADYLACIAALQRRPRCAALLLGYSNRGYSLRGATRQSNERRAHEQAESIAHTALGLPSVQALRQEGELLGDALAATIAFAESDQDPAHLSAGVRADTAA